MEWVPTIGRSATSTDPASIVGKELYANVRKVYSGSIDADAPDFVTYIIGLDSIFTYIGWLKRIYRVISTYSAENFALPDGMLQTILRTGFGNTSVFQNLRRNKVAFWQGINELILQTRKFRCPAVMDLFNRHYWMSDNVYADAPTVRAQLYLFNLLGVYKITELPEADTAEPVTGLQMQAVPSGNSVTVDSLLEFGYQLIQAMDAWDDCYLISGYLMRAFEGTPNFVIAELMQDELMTSQYVPEVLSQIENVRVCGLDLVPNFDTAGLLSQFTITQSVAQNAVVANVDYTFDAKAALSVSLMSSLLSVSEDLILPTLNIRSDSPSVADTVIASRLTSYAKYTVDGTKVSAQVVCGTEMVLQLINTRYYQGQWLRNGLKQLVAIGEGFGTNGTGFSSLSNYFELEQFDWHPFCWAIYAQNDTPTTAIPWKVSAVGDVYNLTVLTPEQLSNLHKICVYSELNSFGI